MNGSLRYLFNMPRISAVHIGGILITVDLDATMGETLGLNFSAVPAHLWDHTKTYTGSVLSLYPGNTPEYAKKAIGGLSHDITVILSVEQTVVARFYRELAELPNHFANGLKFRLLKIQCTHSRALLLYHTMQAVGPFTPAGQFFCTSIKHSSLKVLMMVDKVCHKIVERYDRIQSAKGMRLSPHIYTSDHADPDVDAMKRIGAEAAVLLGMVIVFQRNVDRLLKKDITVQNVTKHVIARLCPSLSRREPSTLL